MSHEVPALDAYLFDNGSLFVYEGARKRCLMYGLERIDLLTATLNIRLHIGVQLCPKIKSLMYKDIYDSNLQDLRRRVPIAKLS